MMEERTYVVTSTVTVRIPDDVSAELHGERLRSFRRPTPEANGAPVDESEGLDHVRRLFATLREHGDLFEECLRYNVLVHCIESAVPEASLDFRSDKHVLEPLLPQLPAESRRFFAELDERDWWQFMDTVWMQMDFQTTQYEIRDEAGNAYTTPLDESGAALP